MRGAGGRRLEWARSQAAMTGLGKAESLGALARESSRTCTKGVREMSPLQPT